MVCLLSGWMGVLLLPLGTGWQPLCGALALPPARLGVALPSADVMGTLVP